MGQDYKKLLNKKKKKYCDVKTMGVNIDKNEYYEKKKKYCDVKTMGVNIDKNEYYEIILSNSAHPENISNKK